MDYLYDATIYSFPNGCDREGYGIGLFRTEDEAEHAIRHYLYHVPGFRDYYCEAEVTRLSVAGLGESDTVYRYVGWNVDENGDETDVVESRCYTQRWEAQQAMELAGTETTRQEWSLDPYRIGSLLWAEGFDREYPGGRKPPTMKQIRTILEGAMEPRRMVKVTFHYSDIDRYFFPLAVGRDLFLCAEEDDFLLDGFTIRRIRDVEALEFRGGLYTEIMAAEGWLLKKPSAFGLVFRRIPPQKLHFCVCALLSDLMFLFFFFFKYLFIRLLGVLAVACGISLKQSRRGGKSQGTAQTWVGIPPSAD